MKRIIDESLFIQAFEDYHRVEEFGYDGLSALFHYLTAMEEDCDIEIELDVVALCCEYAQYDSIDDVLEEHDDISDITELQEHTMTIEYGETNKVIIQCF